MIRRLTGGSLEHYNSMLSSLSSLGLLDECSLIYVRIREHNLKPNMLTLNSLVRACVGTNDLGKADSTIKFMRSNFGLRPDADTYAILISANEAKDKRKEATSNSLQLLDAMKQQRPPIKPNINVCNALISVCCKVVNSTTVSVLLKKSVNLLPTL